MRIEYRCPVCQQPLVTQGRSMQCGQGHNFDYAKEGYIHLLLNAKKSKYDKKLFQSRRFLNERTHLFQPLLEEVAELIQQHRDSVEHKNHYRILDAGTGEGYLLHQLIMQLGGPIEAAGVDIAKEGIRKAAKSYSELDWVVADLANLPFESQQFDTIVNILSPSNYEEFHRTLGPHGQVIKVIPGNQYLQEIRAKVYSQTDKSNYENQLVVQHFEQNIQLIERKEINYLMKFAPDDLVLLLAMTPLTWDLSEDERTRVINQMGRKVSMHFEILVGIMSS